MIGFEREFSSVKTAFNIFIFKIGHMLNISTPF